MFSTNHTQSLAAGFLGGSVLAGDSDFDSDCDDEDDLVNKIVADLDQE